MSTLFPYLQQRVGLLENSNASLPATQLVYDVLRIILYLLIFKCLGKCTKGGNAAPALTEDTILTERQYF